MKYSHMTKIDRDRYANFLNTIYRLSIISTNMWVAIRWSMSRELYD